MFTFLLTLFFGALLGFFGSNLLMIYKPLYGYGIRMYIAEGINRCWARVHKYWYGEEPSLNVKVETNKNGSPKFEIDFNNIEKLVGPMMQQMFSSMNPRTVPSPTCANPNTNLTTNSNNERFPTPASAPVDSRTTLKRPTFNVVG